MKDLLVKTVWIITYFICWPITRIIRPVNVSIDKEVLSYEKEPIILISNHRSLFDAWLLSSSIPFKIFLKLLPIRILGTLDGFNDPLSKILAKLGIIRLVYFMYGVAGIKSAWTFEEKIAPLVDALKHGDTVLIFPEGKLGRGDTVSTFRRGVAYLYNQTMARILPAAINFNFNGHGDRAIVIGAPTRIPEKIIVKEDYDNSYYQESCEYLRRIVLSLYRFR